MYISSIGLCQNHIKKRENMNIFNNNVIILHF